MDDELDADAYVAMQPKVMATLVCVPSDEWSAIHQENVWLRAALDLCVDTLERHLSEPRAVTHAECRMAAQQGHAALDGGKE